MHNLYSPRTLFTPRCAAFLAAWWLAALVSGLWGWGMGNLTPQNALASFCSARKNGGGTLPAACVCAMCSGGAKCCCKTAAKKNTPSERAVLAARCDDGSLFPTAAPLAGGTWHAPVIFAALPVPVLPGLTGKTAFGFSLRLLLRGRTPAPVSPPPLAFLST